MGCSRGLKGRHKEGCRYACKCKFIYAHKKHIVSPMLIFKNSQMFSNIMFRYLITNFAEIKKLMCKVHMYNFFWPSINCDFHYTISHNTHNHSMNICEKPSSKFYPYWKKNVKNTCRIVFIPLSNVCLPLHWFSQNTCLIDNILWKTLLYQTSWKPDTWISLWHWVMGRWIKFSTQGLLFPFVKSR